MRRKNVKRIGALAPIPLVEFIIYMKLFTPDYVYLGGPKATRRSSPSTRPATPARAPGFRRRLPDRDCRSTGPQRTLRLFRRAVIFSGVSAEEGQRDRIAISRKGK